LIEGRFSIGWQWRPEKYGGPSFVTLRRGVAGYKIMSRYPLTEEGWAQAWHEFVSVDPGTTELVRRVLARRLQISDDSWELGQLDEGSLAYLPQVAYLGGFVPGTELVAGEPYDVRFLADRVAVYYLNGIQSLAEIRYSDMLNTEVGGPGLTRSGGGFVGGGLGVAGAAEGMAIAGVLNALTTRTQIKTVLHIEAAHAELFFLERRVTPEALRIELSGALGAIRQAKVVASEARSGEDRSSYYRSAAERLAAVTRLHDEGLLTDEEYQAKRAEIISQL
jgi:hypothetical protein